MSSGSSSSGGGTGGNSSARRRTVVRMKYLATLSAAGIAAACSGGGGDDDNITGPDGGVDGTKPDAYGVVDPLPPPSCFRNSQRPTVTAGYTSDTGDAGADADAEPVDAGDGSRLVELDVRFDRETDVVFQSTASAVDATVVRTTLTPTGGKIIVRVASSTGPTTLSPQVTLCYSCVSAGPGVLTMSLTLNPNNVEVDLSDNAGSCGPK